MAILNFGLRFERLQATFYTQADEMGTIASMAAAKREWARTLGAHERAHVKIIKQVLGSKAESRPWFDFGKANETDAAFTKTAVAMEDLTVALLAGVTPKVRDKGLVAALFGLLTVEARHAAWARRMRGVHPRTARLRRADDPPPGAGSDRPDALRGLAPAGLGHARAPFSRADGPSPRCPRRGGGRGDGRGLSRREPAGTGRAAPISPRRMPSRRRWCPRSRLGHPTG